ncbi:MAG: sigma-70 family RNA polymerase sigma factor [Planctomycetes bacterium]|nr:sigma-70 family RNA polymerase sigma factor [Planctomycetota bacterium]
MVKRALAGDPRAVDGLVLRLACVPRFARALNRRAGAPLDEGDLEDLAQDVLAEVWRRLADFAGRARLETWFFRFADLAFRNAVRRVRRRARPMGIDGMEGDGQPWLGVDEDPGASFDREDALAAVLEHLDPETRDLLEMRFLEELSLNEIAVRCELPTNAVRGRLYRALARLRVEFEGPSA